MRFFFLTTFNTPCKRFTKFLEFWSLKLNTALFQICPISNLFASNKMCQYFFLFHLFVHVTTASGAGQRALRGSLVTIQTPSGNPRIQLHLPERPLRNPPVPALPQLARAGSYGTRAAAFRNFRRRSNRPSPQPSPRSHPTQPELSQTTPCSFLKPHT